MLIFFDIDGTLIDEEKKEMSDSTRKAIEKARRNGHICVINTGRTWKLVNGIITGFTEFDGYILGCGTMVNFNDRTLLHETFSSEMSKRIVEALRKYQVDAVLEGRDNNFHDDLDKIHTKLFYDFITRFHEKNYGSFEESVGNFDKFYAYVEDRTHMEAFRAEFEEELSFVDREEGFFEIMPKGFSKATGMRFLAEKLHVPMKDTVAVGDSSNDIPMLECAHTSIAMGNACKAVLDMADHVTAKVEEDGIQKALEWLGVI